jgi:hypothetical protein
MVKVKKEGLILRGKHLQLRQFHTETLLCHTQQMGAVTPSLTPLHPMSLDTLSHREPLVPVSR